jgi:hypothetical protein
LHCRFRIVPKAAVSKEDQFGYAFCIAGMRLGRRRLRDTISPPAKRGCAHSRLNEQERAPMASYRIYYGDLNGRIFTVQDFEATDDRAAVDIASAKGWSALYEIGITGGSSTGIRPTLASAALSLLARAYRLITEGAGRENLVRIPQRFIERRPHVFARTKLS